MEFQMTASYHQRAASLKKRKQVALKAIETNFNDPAIEKAILHQIIMSQHSIHDKENKSVDSLLPRGGSSKASLYRRKDANTSILTGLSTILGRRAKIAPTIYNQELLAGSSTLQAPSASSELPILLLDLLPDDNDVPVKKSKRRRLTEPLRQEIGPSLLAHVVDDLKKPAQKRPILARFHSYPRRTIEKVIGSKISNREYSNIQSHARGVGAWEPVERVKGFKNRMNPRVILGLFHLLSDPNSLQRHAFGQKFVETFGGRDFVMMDRIETNEKASTLAAKFVVSLFDEGDALANGDIPESHLRCQKIERYTFRRCLCQRDHTEKKCQFTQKNGCSMRFATDLIKTLTGGELKQLTGLDDIKVERGRDNFIRIRRLIDQLCDPAERIELKKQVDEVELFHKTDFPNHLERVSEFACSCLTCGFYNNGTYQ